MARRGTYKVKKYKKGENLILFKLLFPLFLLFGIALIVLGVKLLFPSDFEDTTPVTVTEHKALPPVESKSLSDNSLPVKQKSNTEENEVIIKVKPAVPVAKVDLEADNKKNNKTSNKTSVKRKQSPAIKGDVSKSISSKSTSSGSKVAKSKPLQKSDSVKFWWIQVSSFKDKRLADSLASNLKAKGLKVSIQKANVGGVIWYRVKVYGGKSKDSAYKLAEFIKKNLKLPVLIVPER